MKRFSILRNGLLLLAVVFLIFSCKKDTKVTDSHFNLQFTATNGSKAFYFNEPYKTDAGRDYSISVLAYYISNIRLVKDDGGEVALKDVVWVNYDNNSYSLQGADPTSNGTYFSFAVPSGSYKALRCRLGLPNGLDGAKAKAATDYPNSSPLSDARGANWAMDNTYRIITMSGVVKDQTNGDVGMEYHLRTDSVYHEFEFPGEINVASGGDTRLELNLDVARIFSNGVNSIDIYKDHISDTDPGQVNLAVRVKNNFVTALTRK